jgi:hypothetical protein
MFIEPKSAQDRAELFLEAEYYQITSLVKQLKCETSTNTIVVEKLLFDPTLHHPQVIISEAGLKASRKGACAKLMYAKVNNVLWANGRHYWEITLETKAGNIPLVFLTKHGIMLIIFKDAMHRWVSLRLLGI